MVLQQTIRDMRDRVPELNNSVAQVMATERLLAKNRENLESQVVDLDSKIKASVKMGRDDIATAYIGQLGQAQIDLERTSAQLDHAANASKQALKARDNYVFEYEKAFGGSDAAHQRVKTSQAAGTARANDGNFQHRRRCFDLQRNARKNWPPRRRRRSQTPTRFVLRLIRKCRTSNAKRWIFSFKINFLLTNSRWGLLGKGSDNSGKQISAGSSTNNDADMLDQSLLDRLRWIERKLI